MLEFAVFIFLLFLVLLHAFIGNISFDLAAFVIFILIVAFLVYRDRKKVKLQGIVLIRRTKKGRTFIDRIAKRNPEFWKRMSVIGIAVAIPSLVFVSVFLFTNSLNIIEGGEESGVKFLLPGPVSAPGQRREVHGLGAHQAPSPNGGWAAAVHGVRHRDRNRTHGPEERVRGVFPG